LLKKQKIDAVPCHWQKRA